MIVSIHQPAYLPWLGYFDKIIKSDVFVFLDTVQYEKNSYINRNKIKSLQGELWLTIPVESKGHTTSTLLETRIDPNQNWKKKHIASIKQNYAKAPRFGELFPKLEAIYNKDHTLLTELCYNQLLFWIEELGIKTKVIRASTLPVHGAKSELVLNICKHLEATQYISGSLGRDYLDLESFKNSGIDVIFQDYSPPVYPQLYGDFISHLGVIDYLMNTKMPL